MISEVIVDATCLLHTRISIMVTNFGVVSSYYKPRIRDCPLEVPGVWSYNEGPNVLIPPQHKHTFRLSLYGKRPLDRFYCSGNPLLVCFTADIV